MNEKTVLVTGATSGIGYHVAAELARRGARVIVTGRDARRGESAVAELRRFAGHDRVELVLADASSLHAIAALADAVARSQARLDVLVNNVGTLPAGQRRESIDGNEMMLATNFVAPFALTGHLLPLLERTPGARVVNVVSSAFKMWKRDPFDDIQSLDRYVGIQAHAHAKLLALLFTLALARRVGGRISVNAINPGMAWTPGTQSLTPEAVPAWRRIWPVVRFFQKRAYAAKAARGPVLLASETEGGLSGRYFDGEKEKSLPAHLLDVELQDRVWRLGESLTQIRSRRPGSL